MTNLEMVERNYAGTMMQSNLDMDVCIEHEYAIYRRLTTQIPPASIDQWKKDQSI